MQFLSIENTTRLSELSERVGSRNVEYILALNDLTRTPDIGKQFYTRCADIQQNAEEVPYQRKITILNSFTQDSDVFETAALLSENGWKVLSNLNTFPDRLRIPDTITLPDSTDIIGNGIYIGSVPYNKAMNWLNTPPHTIDPSIFNEYSTIRSARVQAFSPYGGVTERNQWFNLPWGEVTLYSSLSGDSVDFPVYPEEVEDGVKANYTTMPDILYQYEPWYLYQSSGPRSNTYEFFFHRDMWTGDHRDGRANQLIRFCQANCYPEFNGSAVNVSTVSLYVSGSNLITGILTECNTQWSGPLLSDGWYAACRLTLSITEISQEALNYTVQANKPLIG